MLLCLDVGNTHIMGGVFKERKLIIRFRYQTHLIGTSDQFGMFLMNILQHHDVHANEISAVAISSVVPSFDYTIKHTISHYFGKPCFILQSGVKTGLNIKYKNPKEVGADRIANAIAAVSAFPNQSILIVDMGTATTVCAVSKKRDYLGGAILPGLRVAMESLKSNTAKLTEVDIEIPATYTGKVTRDCIQSGLYYGQLGALKEIIRGMQQENFPDEKCIVIGTGGFSQIYKDKHLFDVILPDLVLQGLAIAYEYDHQVKKSPTNLA